MYNQSNNYKFKFISENDFTSILKHVQRSRRKKQEEKEWRSYLESKFQKEIKSRVGLGEISRKIGSVHIAKREEFKNPISQRSSLDRPFTCEPPNCESCPQDKIISNYEDPVVVNDPPLETKCLKEKCSVEQSMTKKGPQSSVIECYSSYESNFGGNNIRKVNQKDSIKNFKQKLKKQNANVNNSHLPSLESCAELKRLEELKSRIINALKHILGFVYNYEDDPKDYDIAHFRKRASEFISLFTRNYLYQMKRQVDEIKKTSSSVSKTARSNLISKILSSFQISIQALQTLEKNLANSLIDGVPNQISEFLSTLYDLSVNANIICNGNEKHEDNELGMLCELVKKHLIGCSEAVNSSNTNNKSSNKPKKLGNTKKCNNLRMYTSNSKHLWIKKSADLAKSKFGAPNFTKKKSPKKKELQKNTVQFPIKPQKFDVKSLKKCKEPINRHESWRKTARCMAEDEVRTMMEIIRPDSPNDKSEEPNCPPPPPLPIAYEVDKENLLIKSIGDMTSSFNVALTGLQELLLSVKNVTHFEDNKKREGIIVSCQTEDSSLIGCSPGRSLMAKQKEKNSNVNVKLLILKEEEDIQEIKNSQKKTCKDEKKLQLSNRDRYIALDYRHYFNEYKRKCFYYKCQVKDKPWDIVSRISDAIVERITREVANALETEIYYSTL